MHLSKSTAGPNRLHFGPTPRVCVIGSGCSGLTSLQALSAAGLPAVGFEMGSDVGGLWDEHHSAGRTAAYRSLRINTSRSAMQFSAFPMSERYGDYPRHDQVAEYFRDFAEHFALKELIEFETTVKECTPRHDAGYDVTLVRKGGQEESRFFDAVVVASGHHYVPSIPRIPGAEGFTGTTLHSRDYRDVTCPLELRGRRVVVLGFGNSAVDIATELATHGAAAVWLSARRGAWVLPRYLLGKPIDQGTLIPEWLPEKLRRRIVTRSFQALCGRMEDFGLPAPDHLIGEAHPTLSDELPRLVQAGRIQVRPEIREVDGSRVAFADGTWLQADTLIYATGYRVNFPFFTGEHVSVADNRLPLFHRVFHPEHRRVFFVGLAQPLGAIMPIAELQARWIAEHLTGSYNLPPRAEMDAWLRADVERHDARYVRSPRHTMQIVPSSYKKSVEAELRRGRVRARRETGHPFAAGPSAASRPALRARTTPASRRP